MDLAILTQIDQQIARLSPDEQLWLIERLAHRLRITPAQDETAMQMELAAMAADPAIQREIRQIEEEFRGTEADGLEDL